MACMCMYYPQMLPLIVVHLTGYAIGHLLSAAETWKNIVQSECAKWLGADKPPSISSRLNLTPACN